MLDSTLFIVIDVREHSAAAPPVAHSAAAPSNAHPAAAPSDAHPAAAAPVARLIAIARSLAPRRLQIGFGAAGERLAALVGAADVRAVAAADVRAVAASIESPGAALLAATDPPQDGVTDLMVLTTRAMTPGSAIDALTLRALYEVHRCEGNAVTVLSARAVSGGAGGWGVHRDAKGRLAGLVEPAGERSGDERLGESPRPGSSGSRPPSGLWREADEVAGGAILFRLEPLRDLLRGGPPWVDTRWPAAWVEPLVGAGGPAGSFLPAEEELSGSLGGRREPDARSCSRCLTNPRVCAASGLLVLGDHAHLGVADPGFNSGELVIFPRRHVTCMATLQDEELAEIAAMLRTAGDLLGKVYACDAVNLSAASGTGGHLAIHLIPRWVGDLNFLPLSSGFKPVPESPRGAWRRYQEVIS